MARIAKNEGGSSVLALSLAEEAWQEKLDELGRAGWELVAEQSRNGGSGEPNDPFWTEFTGTMKRQGPPL
jgi:hypothetical protein